MAKAKVSLCVLRLELSDGDSLKALEFCSKEGSPEGGSSEKRRIPCEEIRRHRGERQKRQITVESYDLNSDDEKEDIMSGPDGDASRVSSKSTSGTTKRPFFSGNPFVEVTEGILHLFKEDKITPGPPISGPSTYAAAAASSSAICSIGRSEMICMLAVPAVLTSHDLLNFIAPCSPDIRHVRIVRDRTPNQYMVLLKFRTQEGADDFYRTFNAMPFNSLEPDVCHLVYVSRVETVKESEGGGLPIGAHTELPTCPVCLERMDESVDGVLTILCNHSFHGACLSKWGDASCPVCRYTSTPELVEQSRCFTCNSTSDLWICLICGNVGCGRYDNKHAEAHYSETQHIYAMQLGTNRVWDYAGDNFVHRLVQNKADGKLVELEGQGIGELTTRDWTKTPDYDQEKLESMQLEYSYLLTSQLESQRHYFEAKLAKADEQSRKETTEIKERAQKLAEENDNLKSQLAAMRAEKKQQEKKTQLLNQKVNKIQQELADEREMNACLRDDKKALVASVEKLKEDAKRRDGEIKELQEQLRDIFFHLEAQKKVEDAGPETKNELQGGQISLPPEGAAGGGSSGKGRRKRSTKNN